MQIQEPVSQQMIAEIAREVVARLGIQMRTSAASRSLATGGAAAGDGVFATVDAAANAASKRRRRLSR